MRSAVLLLLLGALMFTDARSPCQEQNNNGYDKFKTRHILSEDFDTNSVQAWEKYIEDKGLCGRPVQSFIRKIDENRVKRICNGEGITDSDNLCISKDVFTVYIVRSTLDNGQCNLRVEHVGRYVVVACDLVGSRCLPVHYQKQTNTPPSRYGQTCGRQNYRPRKRQNYFGE